jgi:hypothetical protein
MKTLRSRARCAFWGLGGLVLAFAALGPMMAFQVNLYAAPVDINVTYLDPSPITLTDSYLQNSLSWNAENKTALGWIDFHLQIDRANDGFDTSKPAQAFLNGSKIADGNFNDQSNLDFLFSQVVSINDTVRLEFFIDPPLPREEIDLTGTPSVVPIPSTVLVFGSGLILLVGMKRRFQN